MLKLARLPSGEPEIFASIQGEGVSAGRPSTFVRLSLCNLACTWCDTKYTWDWARYDPAVEIVRTQSTEVVERVAALGVENVVITGGEPLMQQDELSDVAEALTSAGHRIEVETNGTFEPRPPLWRHVAQWNVSPKLSNSGNPPARRLLDASLRWFAQSEDAWFKFVMDSPADLDEGRGAREQVRSPARPGSLDAARYFRRRARQALGLVGRSLRPPRLPVFDASAHPALGRRTWPVGEAMRATEPMPRRPAHGASSW